MSPLQLPCQLPCRKGANSLVPTLFPLILPVLGGPTQQLLFLRPSPFPRLHVWPREGYKAPARSSRACPRPPCSIIIVTVGSGVDQLPPGTPLHAVPCHELPLVGIASATPFASSSIGGDDILLRTSPNAVLPQDPRLILAPSELLLALLAFLLPGAGAPLGSQVLGRGRQTRRWCFRRRRTPAPPPVAAADVSVPTAVVATGVAVPIRPQQPRLPEPHPPLPLQLPRVENTGQGRRLSSSSPHLCLLDSAIAPATTAPPLLPAIGLEQPRQAQPEHLHELLDFEHEGQVSHAPLGAVQDGLLRQVGEERRRRRRFSGANECGFASAFASSAAAVVRGVPAEP
mmetsp:Transcript_515/g.1566  ORF Transcript_515/g.1566 Transcript_515/m.1566 type:complete len:343 (-) Transcript_515:108-1136(-)